MDIRGFFAKKPEKRKPDEAGGALAQALAATAALDAARGDAASSAATQQAAAEAELARHLKEQRRSYERQIGVLKADYGEQIRQLEAQLEKTIKAAQAAGALELDGEPHRTFQSRNPAPPKWRPGCERCARVHRTVAATRAPRTPARAGAEPGNESSGQAGASHLAGNPCLAIK